MNTRLLPRNRARRRAATLVLAVFLMVLMLGMVAFAIDVGYIALVRTQLQVAADSSAMAAAAAMTLPQSEMVATARQYAGYHQGGGKNVQLTASDVEYGTWDATSRRFTASPTPGNAIRVTARRDASSGGNASLFFGAVFNRLSFSSKASAVAMANPRDIAFVVDLSGSMNNDTDPDNTPDINSAFALQGYPTVGSELIQQIYVDFGFNVTYPNEPAQYIGQPLGVTTRGDPLSQMIQNGGVLTQPSIPSKYRILSGDSSSVRRQKAFSWTMDYQLPQVMPAAKPTPNSSASYSYWASYLSGNYTKIGYRSYLHFMMYNGRDLRPDGVNYTPLSRSSPYCPYHQEATAGGTFSFPPREQPTHAARRAMIAAIKVIKDRNQSVSDMSQRDWVSIISFDSLSNGGPVIQVALTGDYDVAMQACTRLQACNNSAACTATEAGLITAGSHIKPSNQGGSGRMATNKIVVLLTDGKPNLYSSSSSQIRSYINQYPSSNFYGGQYPQDAALMQTSMVRGKRWYLYPVGIGLECDYDFMDRMARMGATANDSGQSPRGSGNPADYEARLTQIFRDIITNPKLRLVQ